MDSSKYNRSISMKCDTCGGTDFEREEPITDDTIFKCTNCEREYVRTDLIELNQASIDSEVDAVKKEVVGDLTAGLKKRLGKAFR